MKTITCQNDLTCAIEELEKQRHEEGQQLKEAFHNTVESVRPVNIIRNTAHQISSSPNLKREITKAAVVLVIGYIARKLIVASSRNPLRKIAANLAEVAIAGLIARNPGKFKSLITSAVRFVMKLRHKNEVKLLPAASH
jgi:hypothetical protein